MTRRDYNIRGIVILLLGGVLASWLDDLVFADGEGYIADAWSYVTVLLTLAPTARRLHDIDLSGWWQAPFQLATLGVMVFLDMTDITLGQPDDILPLMDRLDAIGGGIYMAVLGGLLVFLGFVGFLSSKHGTAGSNKYGQDPLVKADD